MGEGGVELYGAFAGVVAEDSVELAGGAVCLEAALQDCLELGPEGFAE